MIGQDRITRGLACLCAIWASRLAVPADAVPANAIPTDTVPADTPPVAPAKPSAALPAKTSAARPAKAPPALTINACSLLDRDGIAHVIGLPVEAGVRKDDGLVPNGAYSSACVWEVDVENPNRNDPKAPLGGKSFVILNAMRWPAGSGLAHTFLDSFRQAEIDHTIPGKTSPRKFGDDALWWGDGLAVRKGDVSFGLSVFLPPSDKRPPKGVFEERLAPQILRRLASHPIAK